MKPVRTFVCLPIPLFARDRLAAIQQCLQEIGAEVGWVRPQNIHLTLKFLGSVVPERLQEVVEAVRRAAVPASPILLEFAELDCFPNKRKPRIICAKLKDLSEGLEGLQLRVEKELIAIGFPSESRSFSPHLTLGRIRSGQKVQKLVSELKAKHLGKLRFDAIEMVVMGSQLHPSGVLYTPISRIPWNFPNSGL